MPVPSAMSAGDVVNEYKIPTNYPEHAAVVQIHGPPGLKRGAQVKPAVRPNSLVAPVADDIRQAFVQYDSDHSGYIELRELERVTAALTLVHSPRPLNPSPDPNPDATTQRRALLPAHTHTTHTPITTHDAVRTHAHAKHMPWASTLQARATRPRHRFELEPSLRSPQEVRRQPERPAWPDAPTWQRPSSASAGRARLLWLARHSQGVRGGPTVGAQPPQPPPRYA